MNVAKKAMVRLAERLITDKHEKIIKTVIPSNHHKLNREFASLLRFVHTNGYRHGAGQKPRLYAEIASALAMAIRAEVEKRRQAHAKSLMRAEGQDRNQSMAEQTKIGHVYVISNIGSFGKDVYKIGVTRRINPDERVDELSDASVPFIFDIHAMIGSNDAPALEAALHRELESCRVNKVNMRKEFFRTTLDHIITAVHAHHGHVEYKADVEALEYLETLEIEQMLRGEGDA